MTTELFTIDEPIPFAGTDEEARANYASHLFVGNDDPSCVRCDSRPFFLSASYPCGAEIPRQQRTVYSDGTQTTITITSERDK